MKKRKTVFVRSVWVMLSIFFTLIVAFISVGAHIAGENSAPINKLLGIQTTKKVQLGDTAGDMEHYKSDYVKRDASGNVLTETDSEGYTYQVKDDEAMRDASKAVAEQTAVEGSVLLWNDNGTLPLSTGAGVSLFGMSSVNYITLGNGSGAMSLTPEYGTLAVALRNKGLSVNMELNTHYMSLLKTYKRALGNYGKEQNYLPWFTVNDAPWSAVESVAESTISSYKDTAVMVISRTAGEDYDISTAAPPDDEKDSEGNPINEEEYADGSCNYLELTSDEASVLRGLKGLKSEGKLNSITLLINTSNPMQFAEIVKDEYGIDACVWVGMGGTMSFAQIADVLTGTEYAVSGRTSDTLVYDNYSAPSYANFGDFTWTEYSQGLPDISKEYGAYYQTHNLKYMVYQEGVYVGYKYYETRYEDYVLGQGNAGSYDYSQTVAFPFGYGGSYTEFEHSDYKVTETNDAYQVSMKITNVGTKHSGKDVLQVYMQRPYTEYDKQNGIEKPAVELVGFAKTDLLAPNGGSQTLTVTIDKENLRVYDAYNKRTYILEAGDYYIAAGTDAHDALNNILAAKGLTAEQKARMDATGNAGFVYKDTVTKDDYEIYSVTDESGEEVKITNRFDDADVNLYEGTADQKIEYLSRDDWTGTYPESAIQLKCTNEKMVEDMQYGHEIEVQEGDEMPVYETVTAEEGRLSLAMMIELEYDDEKWQDLLNQMSLTEQQWMCSYGLHFFASAESVDAPGGNSVDGPGGVKKNNPTLNTQFGFPAPVVMAQTWNTALIEKLGVAFAHEALHADVTMLYAPGSNMHRSPYGGRNWEYFSEDGVLSGMMLAAEVKGMQSRGMVVLTKHFAFNDQERNRYGVATFFNEQSAREIYLRPFEIAVRQSDMNGVMSSFNRIGCTWAGAHKGLLTDVLRNEWGFVGIVETDSCTGNTYHMGTKYAKAEGLLAGNDLWMANGSETYFEDSKDNPTVMLALREACHRILYAQLHSCALNGMDTNTRIINITPWWQILLKALQITFAVAFGAAAVMAALSFVFASRKYAEWKIARKARVEAAAALKTEKAANVTRSATGAGAAVAADGSSGNIAYEYTGVKGWLARHKKLAVAIAGAVIAVIVAVSIIVPVTTCGGAPTDPSGPPVEPPAAHTCENECPICGGCLDADCMEEACATKCGANKTAHVYEAENATLEDGLAYYGKMFVQSGETRSWIANLNYNTGATVTFDVYSSVSTTASLVVTINRRKAETIFTNVFGVFVNGTDIGSRPSDVPAYEEQYDESSFIDLNIGCVQLVEGKNTIAFRVLGTGEYSGYNFDKITLLCDDITAAPHLCESVCPTCGKCMDLNCTEADCAEKCGDGKPVTRFEVEDAVLVDGADSLSEMTDFSYTDMTYVGNVNQNYGATITFNVNATQDTTATLVVRLNRREIETVFTDLIGVTVNGEKIERDTIVPFIAKDSQWSAEAFTEISLGCIPLKSGANEIKFTVQTENNVNGYNFDYIELRGEHIEPPAHICESACPVCGGCLDLNCAHAECADKCKGGDVATVFEAEEGELVNGTTVWGDISIGTMGDRKYVQSMNGNQGSKVIFTIMSDEARTVTLTVTSNMRNRETVYTELYGISVNGGANLATGTVVPKTEVQYQDAGFREFNLGCIELQAGENKIVFEVLGTGEYSGYNIDKITLYSDSALTAEA